jgi:hypothetical protein
MLALVTMSSMGTGCIGSKDDECRAGDTCECNGIGNCDSECIGTGCSFLCEGIGNCNFSCPDGDCEAFCKGEGNCNMSCPSGGCVMFCNGIGNCNITDCQDDSCEVR